MQKILMLLINYYERKVRLNDSCGNMKPLMTRRRIFQRGRRETDQNKPFTKFCKEIFFPVSAFCNIINNQSMHTVSQLMMQAE